MSGTGGDDATKIASGADLVRARLSVFAVFASFGTVISTWAVHLPALKAATGMSTATLGTVLVVLGMGSLIGMQATGVVIDRYRSETVAIVGVAAMAAAVIFPLASHAVGPAIAGAFVLGVATGSAEVGMNAAAVGVERDYGRPIMAAFHAVFSIGTVLGSLVGAAGFALRLATWATAAVVAAACILTLACAYAGLRSRRTRSRTEVTLPEAFHDSPASTASSTWRRRRQVMLLGLLAFLILLSEGCAMDWSSLHAQQHLHVSASLGALAVGSFFVAMTVCRFTVDRIVRAVGPVQVLRYGCALAAVGMAIVIVSPTLPVAVVGWLLSGLGLGGAVPQVFTAAGNLNGARSGRTLSRVVGVGYVAIMGGPAIIGWLIEWVSWRGAFVVPLGAVLVCAACASVVAPQRAGTGSGPDLLGAAP